MKWQLCCLFSKLFTRPEIALLTSVNNLPINPEIALEKYNDFIEYVLLHAYLVA